MDNFPLWALGGVGLIGFAAYSFIPPAEEAVLVGATRSQALASLDGRTEDVFGTGLGGLRISSTRIGSDKAQIAIRRINADHEILCHVVITPEKDTQVALDTDCVAPARGEQPDRRRIAALTIVEPVAEEFALAATEKRAYETSGVVDEMLRGIHDPAIGINGDLGD